MRYTKLILAVLLVVSVFGCARKEDNAHVGTVAEEKGNMQGLYSYYADSAFFRDCATGRRYPVAMLEDSLALERAYLLQRLPPGAIVLATIRGRFENLPAMEGEGTEEMLVVERFIGLETHVMCPVMEATRPLTGTRWELLEAAGKKFSPTPEGKIAHVVFLEGNTLYSAFDGCNYMSGTYEIRDHTLIIGPAAGTLMACQNTLEMEQTFRKALGPEMAYAISRNILELKAQDGTVYRFRAGRE